MDVEQWTSIQDAARALGVSERTVYHRIAKGKMASRQDDGKTQVCIDVPTQFQDPVRELSKFVAVEASFGKMASDNLSEALQSFDKSQKRLQWRADAAWVLLISAVGALGYFAYYHRDRLAGVETQHVQQIATISEAHEQQLTTVKGELNEAHVATAQAAGKADALADQVDDLQTKLAGVTAELEQNHVDHAALAAALMQREMSLADTRFVP